MKVRNRAQDAWLCTVSDIRRAGMTRGLGVMQMRPYSWVIPFEQFSKGLHQAHDGIVNEPLPKRWIELIKRLNAEEAMRAEQERLQLANGRVGWK